MSKEIDVCPLWVFTDQDTVLLCGCGGACGDVCDIDSASMYWACPIFERLLKIFREVLGVNETNDKTTHSH